MTGRLAAASLIALLVTVCAYPDEDFAFDLTDEDLVVDVGGAGVLETPLQKVWGTPDATAVAGKLFHFTVPKEAFSGGVKYYEATESGTSSLPNWLLFDKRSGTFRGIPSSQDVGIIHINLQAFRDKHQFAKDDFFITVKRTEDRPILDTEVQCVEQRETLLSIIIDAPFELLKPKQRITAIDNLSQFFGLHYSAFTFVAQSQSYESIDENSIILAGPGDMKHPKSKVHCALQIVVGCEGQILEIYAPVVSQLKEQARDGTISEVTGLSIIGWRVAVESKVSRQKRQALGSGDGAGADFDEGYYDEKEDSEDEDVEYGSLTESPLPNHIPSPSTTTVSPHPHRHHHGEYIDKIVPIEEDVDFYPTTVPIQETTTAKTHEEPLSGSKTETIVTEESRVNKVEKEPVYNKPPIDDDYDDDDDAESETEAPSTPAVIVAVTSPTTVATTESITLTTERQTITVTEIEPNNTIINFTTSPQTTISSIQQFIPNISSSTESEEAATSLTEEDKTTHIFTNLSHVPTSEIVTTTTPIPSSPSSQSPSTIFITTTEETVQTTTLSSIENLTTSTTEMKTSPTPEIRNSPPIIRQRLKKVAITAGKVLSFIIPNDTFYDPEGEPLYLSLLDVEGAPLKRNSWIQFNTNTREIYGLPLEEHVSKWDFIIQATDREGAAVIDKLEVIVHHHKGRRTVAHKFIMKLRIGDGHEFATPIDWQIKIVNQLNHLYNNIDANHITVINVNYSSEPIIFTWTNDSLSRIDCEKDVIKKLMSVLVSDSKEGTPTWELIKSLQPEMRVKSVQYQPSGPCEVPPTPAPSPSSPVTNYYPIARNQIDHINATVGQLLVFTVPEDTFYDPEDGSTRKLKLSLLTIDRQPIPSNHWLQFDAKNQEFYGIPFNRSRSEYQLVCEDSGGQTANDGLVIAVHSRPPTKPSVEFSMTIDMPYESFVNSANMKRKFVDKLRELFRDKDTSSIVIHDISMGSTVVSWTNVSLSTDVCPNDEINQLRQILINDDESVSDRVGHIMGPDFIIEAVSLTPVGVCQGEPTITHPPTGIPIEDPTAQQRDDYLVTYVLPAVIILVMLLLAGIVACVLYRRRKRTGKLNVGDEERRSLRTKGIPVIFQDELEDKPEPGNKTPIIMKEEKPPLPPPEYSKRGESPEEEALYQPPPPFPSSRDNSRGNRPKTTPAYRKPPPYVPP